MRNSLSASLTMTVACAWAFPAYSQDIAGHWQDENAGAARSSPDMCDGSAVSCVSLAAAHWDLADLRARSLSESLAAPTYAIRPGLLLDDQSDRLADDGVAPGMATVATGPQEEPRKWTDHVPSEYATHRGFFKQVGSIKTETLLFLGYFGAQSGKKLFRETTAFHFHNEGWFGKDTTNLGIDKMTHAFDTYLIAEILHMRLHKNTDASEGDALAASILASTLMALNEISDGIETDSGYSMQDVTMNIAGAAFSYLRNTVPGLKEKVAFKVEIIPNGDIYSYRGQKHYEQQRYMFSIKASGFEGLKETPLRFLDLQIGYYGSDFRAKDREAGREPKQHVFVGLGLNLGEIFFGGRGSKFDRAAYDVLDYFQVPYTSLRYDTTGRFGT